MHIVLGECCPSLATGEVNQLGVDLLIPQKQNPFIKRKLMGRACVCTCGDRCRQQKQQRMV